jgi:uncharacterized protein YjbJ (UPF0337 family)
MCRGLHYLPEPLAFLKLVLLITTQYKEKHHMKSSIWDQTEGTFHEVRGAVKEIAGMLINNQDLEGKGLREKLAGKVQKKIGQSREF